MPAEAILIFVAFAVLIGVGAYFGHLAAKKRRQAFRALARKVGGTYTPKDPYSLPRRYEPEFPTLRTGSNRYAYNVIRGKHEGGALFIFDHHYETYSTDSKGNRTTHHHHRTFLLLHHDTDLGHIDVRPEGMFDKLKAAFGFDDVDFESEEFSRRYFVKAEDKKLAYDLFHPQMIEYFLGLSKKLTFTTAGGALLVRRSGLLRPEAIESLLEDAAGLLERVPRYLRKDRSLEGEVS